MVSDSTVTENTSSEVVEDFEALLNESFKSLTRGQIITGHITQIKSDIVYVDLGGKSDGILNRSEIEDAITKELKFNEKDEIEAIITSINDASGDIFLSYEKAQQQKAKADLEKVFNDNAIIKARVVKRNKGGYEALLPGQVRAFIPFSHIDVKVSPDDSYYLEKEFEFRILSFDMSRRRTNIVLSRKKVLEEELQSQEKEAWGQIETGMVLAGKVKNILDFGAFIDLGGIDGLVHLTEISWKKIAHPSEILEIGQDIHVKVIRKDDDDRRISLSIKQTEADPWCEKITEFTEGQIIEGKVTNVTNYGAFVEIGEGITGLVKTPDLSWDKNIRKASDALEIDQTVKTKILSIDVEAKKIALGIKQAEGDPWETVEELYPEDSNHDVKVLRIANFGVFVELKPGLEGLIRKTELGNAKISEVNVGTTFNAKVIHIDVEARKIDLSIRSAELETEVKEMEGYMGKSKKKDKSSQGGSQPNLGNFGSLLDELYSKDKK